MALDKVLRSKMNTCAQYFASLEIIMALMRHPKLEQVILQADTPLVEMTIDNFHLPWEVVRDGGVFTVVRRRE